MSPEWNYIVVGGGSAGCVVAARLSENPSNRVLLLEAGGAGRDRLPFVSAPGGALYLSMNRFFDWCYQMEPDPTCNNRVEILNGGKLLGGGSAINGMMFIRGNKEDYDEWARLRNAGWSYREILPFFRKMEATRIGAEEYHGREGPVRVEHAAPMLDVSHRFIEAAVEAGIPYNSDINGACQEGVSRTPCSASEGIRQSTARTYLRPAMSRPNLKVITGAHAARVIFEKNRATGVAFRQWGRLCVERAANEVILSAGAIRSPQILMLSGVGPSEQLRRFDIPVVVDHPGVGRNHMEHPAAGVVYEVDLPTWNKELRLDRQIRNGLSWLLHKEGPASSGYSQAVAFVRTDDRLARPDVQLSLIPIAVTFNRDTKRIDKSRNLLKVLVNACHPSGRGHLELASADPADPPRIFPRLLGGDDTVAAMVKGVEIVRGIFNTGAMRSFVKSEATPGIGIETRENLEAWLRTSTVDTVHPCGTCKMGQDDLAVVDERLRVRNIENLRVADASIMPTITTGNTNAPTIMIGEKAAAMILEDH